MRVEHGTLMVLIALAASGCQVAGVVADRIAGPAPIPARYQFGPATPVLVLVENYREPTASASDSQRVGRMVSETLTKRNAATIVSQEKLSLVRDARPGAFGKMSIIEIGKSVGAHQVLYIDMGGVLVGAAPGSDVLKGVGSAKVRVIDVSTGNVAFPQDLSEGASIEYTSPMRRAAGAVTPESVRGEALIGLSSRIARLFYTYQPSDMESLDTGL